MVPDCAPAGSMNLQFTMQYDVRPACKRAAWLIASASRLHPGFPNLRAALQAGDVTETSNTGSRFPNRVEPIVALLAVLFVIIANSPR
jgi:hypothetical protein